MEKVRRTFKHTTFPSSVPFHISYDSDQCSVCVDLKLESLTAAPPSINGIPIVSDDSVAHTKALGKYVSLFAECPKTFKALSKVLRVVRVCIIELL